jgi:hypothetical protein
VAAVLLGADLNEEKMREGARFSRKQQADRKQNRRDASHDISLDRSL